jgi:membrane fusion protein (multidrug efflux system)
VPGETIVVEGYHKLSPGVKVKVNNALLKKEDEDQSQTPDSAKTEK